MQRSFSRPHFRPGKRDSGKAGKVGKASAFGGFGFRFVFVSRGMKLNFRSAPPAEATSDKSPANCWVTSRANRAPPQKIHPPPLELHSPPPQHPLQPSIKPQGGLRGIPSPF